MAADELLPTCAALPCALPSPFSSRRWYPMYKWAAWWAPSQLVKTADLDPAGRYLLAVHPHGVLGSFPLMAIGTEALGFGRLFPGIRVSLGKQLGVHA